jgi:hypothetical protein
LEPGQRTLKTGGFVSELGEMMMMKRLSGELLGREELSDSSRMVSLSSFDVRSSKFEIFRPQICDSGPG